MTKQDFWEIRVTEINLLGNSIRDTTDVEKNGTDIR